MHSYGGSGQLASSGALHGAAEWIRLLLTGSVGLVVATLAIGAIGFSMLTGRVPVRRAGQILLGCFILLSAEAIARGLAGLQFEHPSDPLQDASVAAVPLAPAPAYRPTVPVPEDKDPYAGAAVPPAEQDDLL